MWRWGKWSDPFPVGDEPDATILGDHPEARMLQGDDARRAPCVALLILKENLDRFVEVICVN